MLKITYKEIWQRNIFDTQRTCFTKTKLVECLSNIIQGDLLTYKVNDFEYFTIDKNDIVNVEVV